MVEVRYKGTNYIQFGERKIVNGVNEIPEDEFYKLMDHPSFAERVKGKIFLVPAGHPLERPKEKVEPVKVELDSDSHEDDEAGSSERLSVRQLLREIPKSDDLVYLQDLVNNDGRDRVKEAAVKRLEALEAESKK